MIECPSFDWCIRIILTSWAISHRYSQGRPFAHILLPPGASAQQWPCWRNSLCVRDEQALETQQSKCSERLGADWHYASLFRSVFVPSERSVFTPSVVLRQLPEQHMIGGLRLSPSNMQPTATECTYRYLLTFWRLISTILVLPHR